jgi:hypothetical protein
MGKLVLRLPDGATREIALERERVTIGRRADNDICLPYPAVSGEHAAVVTILDDSFLEDLNSTNGTLVNGKAITKHFLRDHDEIDIGRHKLVYYSGNYPAGEYPRRLSGAAAGEADGPDLPLAAPAGERFPPVAAKPEPEGTLPLQPLALASATGAEIDTTARFVPSLPDAPRDDATSLLDRAPSDAPSLEVLDGPSAGRLVAIARDDFVLGRVGEQLAAVQRTADGYRLVHLEGDVRPKINGAALPDEGSLLALGDEIQIAGTRIVYRPQL